MSVTVDINKIIGVVGGGLVTIVIGIISFFLSSFSEQMDELVTTVKQIQIEQAEQRGQIIGRLEAEQVKLKNLENRVIKIEDKLKEYDNKVHDFYTNYDLKRK